MDRDSTALSRTAQLMTVECRIGSGSPPVYGPWRPVWGAKVDRIEINAGGRPSLATVWFPDLRWDAPTGLAYGDMLRIRYGWTIIFCGFITTRMSDFSGGSEQAGSAYERNAIVCQDHRWLLGATCPVFGQLARGADDYSGYAQYGTQYPLNSYVWLTGCRAIFNADGKPNRDPEPLNIGNFQVPIFADPDIGQAWTARDMLSYVLSPFYNQAYRYLPIDDVTALPGISHPDWDTQLNHIVVDGLNVIEAVVHICNNLGWSFREDYLPDGSISLRFYKLGAAAAYARSDYNPTILHWLHAPAPDESVAAAITQGRKMLWSMSLAEDVARLVNNPWGLGAVDQFEFTAELVPAWLDADLVPDESGDKYDWLYLTEADLQLTSIAPYANGYTYYRYYHPRGAEFRRSVGRKWALNESGRYTAGSYDRGGPFDFTAVIPPEYVIDGWGARMFAPFNRRLLACLTADKDSLNSVGIKVEFSFDGGATWQVIPASISSLKDECGIYIDETNLAEMADQAESSFDEGQFEEMPINYWTSLCDDKLNERSFKTGQWHTRVRITASLQMDQRLCRQAPPTPASGSPFHQSQIYDFSEKYGLKKRTASSTFCATDLPVWNVNDSDFFDRHLDAVRDANDDMSISGRFTLERLWLGGGNGFVDFMPGDCIEQITGRQYGLSTSFGGATLYPEIISIIYLPDRQKMQLITRDLRFADVMLRP